MANSDNPNGFTPVRHLSGGTIRSNVYKIVSGTNGAATGIFSGDVMTMEVDGYANDAAVTEAVLGICDGFQYTDTSGNIVFSKYLPADTATLGAATIDVFVYDDPNIIFAVQCSGTGAFADNRAAFDHIKTHAGSTTTGRSGNELSATPGDDGQFVQLGLHEVAGNAWGAHAIVEVIINEHALKTADTA